MSQEVTRSVLSDGVELPKLGRQLQVFSDFRLSWLGGAPAHAPDKGQTIQEHEAIEVEHRAWQKYLTIDLCPDWAGLCRALFASFQIKDRGSSAVFSMENPSKGTARQKELVAWLGLPEAVLSEDCGFALVRKEKQLSVQHLEQGLEGADKIRQAMAELEHSHKAYFQFFQAHGSHVVAELAFGDILGQVFAYPRARYQIVENEFTEDMRSGLEAMYFSSYTQPFQKDDLGYTRYAGKIWLASNGKILDGIRPETADPVNQVRESIFALLKNADLVDRLHHLQEHTVTGFSLIPIAEACSGDPHLIQASTLQARRAVGQGESGAAVVEPTRDHLRTNTTERSEAASGNGAYHFFGREGEPNFEKAPWPDYAALYRDFLPEQLTYLCGRHMSIKQPFFNLDLLEENQVLYRDQVETLTIVADIIQITRKNVAAYGKNITLICRRLVCGSRQDTAPGIRLPEGGSLAIYAGDMLGTLSIHDADGARTVADGEIIKTEVVDGFAMPRVVGRIDDPMPESFFQNIETSRIAADLLEGLEFNILSIETMLTHGPKTQKAVARAAALHMATTLAAAQEKLGDKIYPYYPTLQVRAATAAIALVSQNALLVPPYAYPAFKPLMAALFASVEAYEKEKDTLFRLIENERRDQLRRAETKTMNDNLRSLGTFLRDQTQAMRDHEQDVGKNLDKLEAERQEAREKSQAKLTNLLTDMKTEFDAFEAQTKKFQTAAVAHTVQEAIFMAVDLVLALGSVAVNLAALADFSNKIASAGEKARDGFEKFVVIMARIEAFIKFIKSIEDLFKQVKKGFNIFHSGQLNEILDRIKTDTNDGVLPSEADWTEFEDQFKLLLSGVPGELKGDAGKLNLAATRMVRVAKSYLGTIDKISRMQLESQRWEWEREVSSKQQARLDQLIGTLSTENLPEEERTGVDFFNIAALLNAKSNAMRLGLVQTLVEQNAALAYFYLKPPSRVSRYDMQSLRQSMVEQEAKALRAFSPENPLPSEVLEPIEVHLQRVPVAELQTAAGYRFNLGLNHQAFRGHSRVRILEVRAFATGVQNPETNKIFFRLRALANPFHDRDANLKGFDFRTVPFAFHYLHDLKQDKPLVSNRIARELQDKFTSMTPFTDWQISVPANGVDNEGLVFDEPLTDITLQFFVTTIYTGVAASPLLRHAAARKAAVTPSVLMADAKDKSVTNGWDAVCILDMEKVNNLFAERYEAEKGKSEQTLARDIHLKDVVIASDYMPLEQEEDRLDLEITVGAPMVNLLNNYSVQAAVSMDVLKGKAVKRRYFRERAGESDPWPEWEMVREREYPVEPGSSSIRCDVALQKLRGNVVPALNIGKEDYQVAVKLEEGVFGQSIQFKGMGPLQSPINDALKAFFQSLAGTYNYVLGIARWTRTSEALMPTAFDFVTRIYDDTDPQNPKGALVMLIKTKGGGGDINRRDVDLDDDRLLAQGHSATLIINSKLVFEQLLKPQLTNAWPGAGLVLWDRGNGCYGLKGSGSIFIETLKEQWLWQTREEDVRVPFSEFKVLGVTNYLTVDWNMSYTQIYIWYNSSGFGAISETKLPISITASSQASIRPGISGGRPYLGFDSLRVEPSIDWAKSDFWDTLGSMASHVPSKEDLGRKLGGKIKSVIGPVTLNLNDLSLFAVSNLLFPNATVLNLSSASAGLPGDLWVVGDVSETYKPL